MSGGGTEDGREVGGEDGRTDAAEVGGKADMSEMNDGVCRSFILTCVVLKNKDERKAGNDGDGTREELKAKRWGSRRCAHFSISSERHNVE